MIKIPENAGLTKEMKDLILFFNQLERTLRAKTPEEQIKILHKAEGSLSAWGKI